MKIVFNAFLGLEKKRDLKHHSEMVEMPCFNILEVKYSSFSL